MAVLVSPDGGELPQFNNGWILGDGRRVPFFSYAEPDGVNWSEELESLHEESSRTHFIDEWTRAAVIKELGKSPRPDVIADLGCSSGYLLEDLADAFPKADLIGLDLVAAGLQKAHARVPRARLVQADACALPFADDSVGAIASANLLEHIPDDTKALREVRRVLVPGGRAVFVVPAGRGTYDYYDKFLGHERRYARGELAGKAREAGLGVSHDGYIASLIFLPFWLVKKRNRSRYSHLRGRALEQRVSADIANTSDSRVGRMLWRLEDVLRLRLPFGIRSLVVVEKSLDPTRAMH